ncbi:ATP-binding protein [Alteromonas macleodii]|uniref:ATP-binding protein n=1 Tax=Alteromonas macleodii TaxID=28108 RepID=UPI00313EBCE1
MNNLNQSIKSLCDYLRIPMVYTVFSEQEGRNNIDESTFAERLLEQLRAQADSAHESKVARLQKAAKLRWPHAVLSYIQSSDKPPVRISKLKELAQCQWIEDFRHIIISGPTGAGKTHLACALGQEALLQEYTVQYYHYPVLIRDLKIAEKAGDDSLEKLRRKLSKVRVLLIDDWGIQPLNPQERHLLFELIEIRDQSSSLIITSQYAPSDWYDAFGDRTVADSTLDRIVPYAIALNWDCESYRDKRGRQLSGKGGGKND